jgi:UDP-GlcNAc:undecaprenyl-phosphate GlcNAc-1-phosphate transferase
MSDAARVLGAFCVALTGVLVATPLAIRVADRLGLHDVPTGWKSHARPTPYLGGAGVLAGLVLATVPFASGLGHFGPLLVAAVALAVLGALDDRRSIPAKVRIAAVAAVAIYLRATGLGWDVFGSDALNVVATVAWTLGVVNAVNLLDLMDGAAATAAAAITAAVCALALALHDAHDAAFAVAVCAGCIAFLRFNLARPARIFLGDGGSMPLGMLIAALIMALPWRHEVGAAGVLGAILLVGLPIFDMTFRIYSRLRRGDTLMTAGPDSIANWLGARLRSPHAVAVAIALVQGGLGAVAVLATTAGRSTLVVVSICAFGVGVLLIYALDASGFGRATTAPADG